MKNYGSFMMIVGIIAGLFQPAIFTSPVPEPVTTGTLIATTVDETGATVPNACFSLIDDVGTNVPNCDQDGDGVTEFQDVEQGSYRLMNTTIDAGHRPAPEITVAVVAEQVVPVTVTASRILPTETPAPTQGPSLTSTATATEAPTATIAPTATEAPRPASPTATAPATQPVASPTATMAPQSFSDSLINLAVTQTEPVEISCSRIPNSEANNGTYTVNLFNFSGDQATSDPDLMVTGTALTWDYKIVTLDAWHDYNHTFVQPWRRLDVVVTWPDGQQGKGIAECDNFTYDSLVRTQIMSGETEVPVVNAFLPAGRPMNDTATLNPATSEGDLQVLPPWGKTPPMTPKTAPAKSPIASIAARTARGPRSIPGPSISAPTEPSHRPANSPCRKPMSTSITGKPPIPETASGTPPHHPVVPNRSSLAAMATRSRPPCTWPPRRTAPKPPSPRVMPQPIAGG